MAIADSERKDSVQKLYYDGEDGTGQQSLANYVLDLIYAGLLVPSESKQHRPMHGVRRFGKSQAADWLMDMLEWAGTSDDHLLFAWDPIESTPLNRESVIPLFGSAINQLHKDGILYQEESGKPFRLPQLNEDQVRAHLAVRDTLDRLVALRILAGRKTNQVPAFSDNGDFVLDKANDQIERQNKAMVGFKAAGTAGHDPFDLKSRFRLTRLRMRFIRADRDFHLSLSEGLNLDFIRPAMLAAHMLPDLHYVGLMTAQGITARPPTKQEVEDAKKAIAAETEKIAKRMQETIDEHQGIVQAIEDAWRAIFQKSHEKPRSQNQRVTAMLKDMPQPRTPIEWVDAALHAHLNGTFDH